MTPIESLFEDTFVCPTCRSSDWRPSGNDRSCRRCGYSAQIGGRHVNLLPEHLSSSNQREADYFDTMSESERAVAEAYMLNKPYNYPRLIQEEYLRCCATIREQARDLGPDPSILFVFGGGGMEAHLSNLLGPRVVLADISAELLSQAEKRFAHYGVAQPAAFVTCDAEHLPFADNSFDLVVGFEGIHHCMIPQASLAQIWQVARHRAFIVDNYECALTNLLFSVGRSSAVEYSGLKPNRFTRNALATMMQNANIASHDFRYYASIPPAIASRLGYRASRAAASLLEKIGQTNKFMLSADKKAP